MAAVPRWGSPGLAVAGSVPSEFKARRGDGKETGLRGKGAVVAEVQGSLLQSQPPTEAVRSDPVNSETGCHLGHRRSAGDNSRGHLAAHSALVGEGRVCLTECVRTSQERGWGLLTPGGTHGQSSESLVEAGEEARTTRLSEGETGLGCQSKRRRPH